MSIFHDISIRLKAGRTGRFWLAQSGLYAVQIVLCAVIVLFSGVGEAAEDHADRIIAEILHTRQSILAAAPQLPEDRFIFLAFWDFDGTILKGDCTEGLRNGETLIYPGLAQIAIESGYSLIYPAQGGAEVFRRDYEHMEKSIGRWLAYPFVPQMLRGAKADDIRTLSRNHFRTVLSRYYFASSLRILSTLEKHLIENHILSASADVFLNGAAETLALPAERFHGIEVAIENGKLTEKLVAPVTLAEGKTEKLRLIVEEAKRHHPGRHVFVLAGFGDSNTTDGPFLQYIAAQNLPAGKPVTVMINTAETPPTYRGLFQPVRQSELVTSPDH